MEKHGSFNWSGREYLLRLSVTAFLLSNPLFDTSVWAQTPMDVEPLPGVVYADSQGLRHLVRQD